MQGMARSGSGLRAHTGVVDQGSAAAAVGLDSGDDSDSGLVWSRRHSRAMARTGVSNRGAQGTDHWTGKAHW